MVGIKIESIDAIWIWEFGNNVIFQAQNKNIEHIYNVRPIPNGKMTYGIKTVIDNSRCSQIPKFQ